MSTSERYRRLVGATGAAVTGGITWWAAADGLPVPLIGLSALVAIFFLGSASHRVRDAVPQYQRTGLLVVGAVAAVLLVVGYRREMLVGLAVVGLAAAADLVVGYVRGNRSNPN